LGLEELAVKRLSSGAALVLKGGIRDAVVTTASRTYMNEIQTPEFDSLDGILRDRRQI
jgi:glycogen synthase